MAVIRLLFVDHVDHRQARPAAQLAKRRVMQQPHLLPLLTDRGVGRDARQYVPLELVTKLRNRQRACDRGTIRIAVLAEMDQEHLLLGLGLVQRLGIVVQPGRHLR